MCVGVPFQCGYGGVVSLCSLKHSSWFSLYSTIKMMHGPINIRVIVMFIVNQAICLLGYYLVLIDSTASFLVGTLK